MADDHLTVFMTCLSATETKLFIIHWWSQPDSGIYIMYKSVQLWFVSSLMADPVLCLMVW